VTTAAAREKDFRSNTRTTEKVYPAKIRQEGGGEKAARGHLPGKKSPAIGADEEEASR